MSEGLSPRVGGRIAFDLRQELIDIGVGGLPGRIRGTADCGRAKTATTAGWPSRSAVDGREPGPLRTDVRPPRWPALHDRQMPVSDINLDPNLITDMLGHPARHHRCTRSTSVSGRPLTRLVVFSLDRCHPATADLGGHCPCTSDIRFNSASLTSSGRSCWIQCPAPSMIS